jgi:hypothetical protein
MTIIAVHSPLMVDGGLPDGLTGVPKVTMSFTNPTATLTFPAGSLIPLRKYRLDWKSGAVVVITALADGSFTPAQTKTYTPGTYTPTLHSSKDGTANTVPLLSWKVTAS